MKKVSIVIPLYNGADYIESTVESLLAQSYSNIEVVVSDDAGPDNSRALVESLQGQDERIVLVGDGVNRGTLGARKLGVEASTGDYIMFVDQDDELTPDAIANVVSFAAKHTADIYHFSAKVIPDNEAARGAAAGMQSFLTPPERELNGESILVFQLSQNDGFDWHLHHKMYESGFARKAYEFAPDTRLIQSDDFYMCFIMTALAQRYYAIPDAPYYIYHLGRGETFGAEQTVAKVLTISSNNIQAYRLLEQFTKSDGAPKRNDWEERLSDAQRCLLSYPMNEWRDALSKGDQTEALPQLLTDWQAEYVCAELWRFSRDTAYALFVQQNQSEARSKRTGDVEAEAHEKLLEDARFYRDLAFMVEREYHTEHSHYSHYQLMRQAAIGHLCDTGLHRLGRGDTAKRYAEGLASRARALFSHRKTNRS